MSSSTHRSVRKDAWQTPRNARTLRVYMALRNQEIAGRLRDLRGEVPQTRVAEEIGAAERTYQTWESGDAKPSWRFLERLAEYYKVSVSYIVEGAESDPMDTVRVSSQVEAMDAKYGEHVADLLDQLARVEDKLDRQYVILGDILTALLQGSDALRKHKAVDQLSRAGRELAELGQANRSVPVARREAKRASGGRPADGRASGQAR